MPGRVQVTNTMFFVCKQDIPTDRKKDITYRQIVCNYQPGKAEPNRTRLTVGGDWINYLEDCRTPTAVLLNIKLMLNSIISMPNAKFMTMDIINVYFNIPLNLYKYICLKLAYIPPDVTEHYVLH